VPRPPVGYKGYKTDLMLLLESRYEQPIQDLIREGSVRAVAKRLGINIATVSVWRRNLRNLGVMV